MMMSGEGGEFSYENIKDPTSRDLFDGMSSNEIVVVKFTLPQIDTSTSMIAVLVNESVVMERKEGEQRFTLKTYDDGNTIDQLENYTFTDSDIIKITGRYDDSTVDQAQ